MLLQRLFCVICRECRFSFTFWVNIASGSLTQVTLVPLHLLLGLEKQNLHAASSNTISDWPVVY